MKIPATMILFLGILPRALLGQTYNARAAEDLPSVIAARCQLTSNARECGELAKASKTQGPAQQSGQLAQHYPGPYHRPCCRGGYDSAYPPDWSDNGHHAAIGALIGFGLGATVGATANPPKGERVAASLVVGSIGALLGAAFGHAMSTYPVRRPYRGPWTDEHEDDIMARRHLAKPARPSAKERIDPTAPATAALSASSIRDVP